MPTRPCLPEDTSIIPIRQLCTRESRSICISSSSSSSTSSRRRSREARERHPSAARPAPPPYGVSTPYESPNYPQPSYPSPMTSLGSQVSFLEDRIVRLIDVLQVERIDNLRTNIENTTTMLGLIGWMQKQLRECL